MLTQVAALPLLVAVQGLQRGYSPKQETDCTGKWRSRIKKRIFFHHFLSHPIGLTALTTYNRGRFVLRTGAGHRILPGFFLWTIKKHD